MTTHGGSGFFQLRGKWWLGMLEEISSDKNTGAQMAIVSARNIHGEYVRVRVPVANWQAAANLYIRAIATPQDYPEQAALLESGEMGC